MDFQHSCFGDYTNECITKRVEVNVHLLEFVKKQQEDNREKLVQQMGVERYNIMLGVLDREIKAQEADKPGFIRRWFFGDNQAPYFPTRQYILGESDIENMLDEVVREASKLPPLLASKTSAAPIQVKSGIGSSPEENQAALEARLEQTMSTPVTLAPGIVGASTSAPAPQSVQSAPNASTPVTATPTPAAAPVAISPTLAKLFVPDAIQGNVAWLESMTGPARQVQDNGNGTQKRIYQVDGCKVTALATKQTINELTLDLGAACNVALHSMIANGPDVTVNGLSFADVFKNGAGEIELQCAGYNECGNSADPSMQASLGGSHADNFMQVVFSGTIAGDKDVDALQDLMKAESAHTGKVDMDLDAKVYNKDPQFSGLVEQKMGGVKVTSITFKSSM